MFRHRILNKTCTAGTLTMDQWTTTKRVIEIVCSVSKVSLLVTSCWPVEIGYKHLGHVIRDLHYWGPKAQG